MLRDLRNKSLPIVNQSRGTGNPLVVIEIRRDRADDYRIYETCFSELKSKLNFTGSLLKL